jgi:hypothetical protein
VVGVLFLIVGLVLLSVAGTFALQRESVVYSGRDWKAITGAAVMASVFLVAGWYIFRFDPDAPERVQRTTAFSSFLRAHRREIQVLALFGFLVSMGRLVGACFGADWLGWWADWPLTLGLLVLLYWSRKVANVGVHRDWTTVPTRPRLIKKAEGFVWLLYLLLLAFVQVYPRLSHTNRLQYLPGREASRSVYHIVLLGTIAILYALEALFFSCRELGPDAGQHIGLPGAAAGVDASDGSARS